MNQKILIGVSVFLAVIVLLQSIYLYRVTDQVEQLRSEAVTWQQSSQPDTPDTLLSPDRPQAFGDPDWNPFREMQRMQNEMNKIFGDMRSQLHLGPSFDDLGPSFSFSPSVDIKEEKDRIIVTADLPGSDESNINVTVEERSLSIAASTKKSANNNSGNNMFRSERFVGQFQRTIILPAPVLAEKMKTDYQDGVLTITLPKA